MPDIASSDYKCDKCGADVGESDTKCPKCGEPFDEDDGKAKCPHCGAEVRAGDIICRRCGKVLRADAAGPSLFGLALMVVGGGLYLISFIYAFMASSPGSTTDDLAKYIDNARFLSTIGMGGVLLFMAGSVFQAMSLWLAVKAKEPEQKK